MPAIRDIYNTSKAWTDTNPLSLEMPQYQAGDLLLIYAQGGTTSGLSLTAPSGWNTLLTVGPTANNNATGVFWKIAGASESPASVGVSGGSSALYGVILSARDVNTSNPFGASPVYSQTLHSAASRWKVPQITTTVNDSLVLYFNAVTNATASPSAIEGPVIQNNQLWVSGAGSLGVSWGMQRTAGLTPAVYANQWHATAGVVQGVSLTLQVAPPGGGATVIPAYCAADPSVILDVLAASSAAGTAWNGNGVLSSTFGTNFTATLNGKTIIDGTLTTTSQTALNGVRNVSNMIGFHGSALELALASGKDCTGKNVLVHFRPNGVNVTPRLSPCSAGDGIQIGLRSAAENYKVWHCHSGDTAWPIEGKVPMVVHPDAAAIASGGSFDKTSVQAIGFSVGTTNTMSMSVGIAMAWLLDAVTVAGGTSSEPIGLRGILDAAAAGHERMSCLLQGAAQLLVMQPVQFGDGGANGVYLDLNNTAIEFPRQYDTASKTVFYNSVDNAAGLTYYAGSGDTLKHRNSVVESASRYHWRIHASSAAGAAYDFSGLTLIGAGDVQLRALSTAFSRMTFQGCDPVQANGATIQSCAFSAPRTTGLVTGYPDRVSGCSFVSAGTGHGVEITAPGTYSFSGNMFSGYGAAGTTNAAVYNNSGGAVTLNITGGGTVPTVRNGTGASTTVTNNRTLTVTGIVSGSRILIRRTDTSAVLVNATVGGTSYAYTYDYAADIPAEIILRNASGSPAYQEWRTTATLGASDASLAANQVQDQ